MNVTPLPQPVVPEPPATPQPAWAYVYAGDWVADCPRGCNNVEFLFSQSRMNGPRDQRKPFYLCSHCGYSTDRIIWPRREHEIIEILMRRPVPHTRNWYPKDHPVAVSHHLPHGQTPAELVAESEEHGVI